MNHGTWAAIKHHRRNRQPLCESCVVKERDYNREYSRLRRQTETYQAQKRDAQKVWLERNRVAVNAYNRRRYRIRQQAADLDRLHAVDPVVVERLVVGIDVTANRAEKYAAYAALRDRGVAHSAALEQVRASSAMRRPFAASYSTPEAERRSA